MEREDELIRRARDLAERCERRGQICSTGFLSPAQQQEIKSGLGRYDCKLYLSGGAEGCQRQICFFLPDYMEPEELELGEYIKAIELKAYFGQPGHRDYMGALLGMGIGREWLGDIQVQEDKAWVFCMKSVLSHLLTIEKAGRYTVKAREIELGEVPNIAAETKELRFSVMSLRLDAVAAGMFRLSRTECARLIKAGDVTVNYVTCMKADKELSPGDVVSIRGKGKAQLGQLEGQSRKGRRFVSAEIYK